MDARSRRGHRVVVTGLGLMTPVGNDVPTTWNALLNGVSGAAPITHFEANQDYDARFAAEVKGFNPENYLERKEARRMDLFAQFAMAATQEAMKHSGLEDRLETLNRDRFGVIIGSRIGGIATFEEQARAMVEKGPK